MFPDEQTYSIFALFFFFGGGWSKKNTEDSEKIWKGYKQNMVYSNPKSICSLELFNRLHHYIFQK